MDLQICLGILTVRNHRRFWFHVSFVVNMEKSIVMILLPDKGLICNVYIRNIHAREEK